MSFLLAWPSVSCAVTAQARASVAAHLLDDLEDVAVRVEDPELAVGAVAADEDLLDPLELALRAELACMRLDLAHRTPHELRDRDRSAGRSRDPSRRLEPVAACEPLVLAGQDPVVARDLSPASYRSQRCLTSAWK